MEDLSEYAVQNIQLKKKTVGASEVQQLLFPNSGLVNQIIKTDSHTFVTVLSAASLTVNTCHRTTRFDYRYQF
jgi:hypothetical protein